MMIEQTLLWIALVMLALLCLPVPGARKLVLGIYGLALGVGLMATLAGGAYLFFRPEEVPADIVRLVNETPLLSTILPVPGTPTFGLAASCLIAAIGLPLLAVIDVTCRLANRTRRLRALTSPMASTASAMPAAPASERRPETAPTARRPDRRTAADTMAEIGSRKPFRVADHVTGA